MQVKYNVSYNLFEVGRNDFELQFFNHIKSSSILVSWYDYQVGLRRWWIQHKELFKPSFLVLNVTGRCPRYCWYCYAKDYRFTDDLIMVDDVIGVVNLFGIDRLFVLGGEPLLRLQFLFDLLSSVDFKSKGIATSLPFLNDDVLMLLKRFDRIKISVDGNQRKLNKDYVLAVKRNVIGDVIVKYTISPGDVNFRHVYDWCMENNIVFELGWVMWNSMLPGVERGFLSQREIDSVYRQIGDDNVFRERNGLYDFLNPVWDGELDLSMLKWWYPCPIENSMIAMNSLGVLHCCDELNVSVSSDRYRRMRVYDLESYYDTIESWWNLALSCERCDVRWLCKGLCLFGFQQKNEQICDFIRKYIEITIKYLDNRYGVIPFIRYNRFWLYTLKHLFGCENDVYSV